MRRHHAVALLGVPVLLAAGWMGVRTTQEDVPQEPPAPGPGYHFESQHYSVGDAGRLLQRLGTEIQRNASVTVGGKTYPVTGFGGMEFAVNRRGTRTGAMRTGIEFGLWSDGRTTPPTGPRRQDYDPYQSGGRNLAPADVANVISKLAETLAGTGAFVMEEHRVPFKGAARIDQRLIERLSSRQQPYNLEVHVVFGEGEFAGPDDDQDYREDQEYGLIKALARTQRQGADRAAVAAVFASLARNLNAGRVRVGDQDLAVGETVGFGLTHVTAIDGRYDKIEFGLRFGPVPERRPEGARYGDEAFNRPTRDLAAILRRLGAEILEAGTFRLGDEVFTVPERASWELHAGPRGFAVEVHYR